VTAWRTAVPRLSRFAVEHLLLLPLGAAIALVWVNLVPESYFQFTYAIAFAVNDIAMVFFFGLITKEVVEATAPGGVLHPWQRALLPVVASIGAMIVPALIHMQVVEALEEPMLAEAWPVSLAVDLAVTYFVARFIFRRHPIIPFLMLVGIASDAFGLLAVALISPTIDVRLPGGALILAAAILVALGLRRYRVKSFWPYLVAAGGLSWYAFFYSGLHPALALVPIVPLLPHAARDPGFFVDASPQARDTLSRFEVWWKYPAQVALFFFGLVNVDPFAYGDAAISITRAQDVYERALVGDVYYTQYVRLSNMPAAFWSRRGQIPTATRSQLWARIIWFASTIRLAVASAKRWHRRLS
jgi:NhaA family Na+:H+ antiporter